MIDLRDLIYHILSKHKDINYPLPNSRLTKIIFLLDWISCLRANTRITNFNWYIDSSGPYVRDVVECIKANSDIFQFKIDTDDYGNSHTSISLNETSAYRPQILEGKLEVILNLIIDSTKKLEYSDFIGTVLESQPVIRTSRFHYVKLEDCASEVKKEFSVSS
jgi:hypothetical protein